MVSLNLAMLYFNFWGFLSLLTKKGLELKQKC